MNQQWVTNQFFNYAKKGAEKKLKGNWYLCGKWKVISNNARFLCCGEKNKVSDEFRVTFLVSDYITWVYACRSRTK